MMRIKLIFLCLLFLLLSGCSYTEPDATYTVTALAFSRENGLFVGRLQAVDAAAGEQGGKLATFTVTGRGDSVDEALDSIISGLSKKPSFMHCSLVMLQPDKDAALLSDTLKLCDRLDIPLHTGLAVCPDTEAVLEADSGTELAAMISQSADRFGFGGHTAIFEIETAVITANGDFALPYISLSDGAPSVGGLMLFENSAALEKLDIKESVEYAKNRGLYTGGQQ